MKKRVKVSANRQLAIPAEFHRNLGEPEEFEVIQDGDRLILVPVRLEDRFREFTKEIRDQLQRTGLSGEELAHELERRRQLLNSALSDMIDELQQDGCNDQESH